VECDPDKLSGAEGKYIRANPIVVGQDLKTYDHGLFQLAVCNSPAAFVDQVIGELWVSYTVILRKPKFFTGKGLGISQDLFVSGAGTETTTAPMGTLVGLLKGQQNNIGCTLVLFASAVKIFFPAGFAGFLEITMCTENAGSGTQIWAGPTLVGQVFLVADQYGAGQASPDDSPSGENQAPFGGVTSGRSIVIYHVRVTPAVAGIDNTFQLNLNALTQAPSQTALTIKEYNSGFSYKAQNIGPIGSQSDAPVLVNASGVIVVP